MLRFWSIPLFRLFGIRLELHLTFLLLLAWVTGDGLWQGGWAVGGLNLILVLSLFACVVLHELGHSLMARAFGVQVLRIVLLPIGGMAQFDRVPREPGRELLITVAGPAVNFGLVLLLWPLLAWRGTLEGLPALERALINGDILAFLFAFNLGMGIFNLLPAFPMDGGRMLRALLAFRWSYLTATRAAIWTARPLLVSGIAWALIKDDPHYLLAALFGFIFWVGGLEYRAVSVQEALQGLTVGDLTRRRFHLLTPDATVADALLTKAGDPGGAWPAILADEGRITGAVSGLAISRAARSGGLETSLRNLAHPRRTILHPDWPLELMGDSLMRQPPATHPVARDGELIGVLETGDLRRRLFTGRLLKDLRE